MVFDRHGNELPTESVLGMYLFQSTRSMWFLFLDGKSHHIAKSMISNINDVDITNFEEYQYLEIAQFLTEIYDIPIEY